MRQSVLPDFCVFILRRVSRGDFRTRSFCFSFFVGDSAMARRGIANYEPAQPHDFNIFWSEILRSSDDGINGSLGVADGFSSW